MIYFMLWGKYNGKTIMSLCFCKCKKCDRMKLKTDVINNVKGNCT